MKKKWVIYKITSPSNRIYIGITSNLKKRLSYYKNNNSTGQKKISASFNKYGFENHKIEVIDEIYGTISEGLSKEIFWIKSYMSNCVKYPEMRGLNLTDGGQGTIGYKATDELRKRLSDYHKANPSRGMKGKKISEETKNKIRSSMIRSGWIKPKKIKPTKEETRLKQSLAKKGKPAWNKGIPMLPHVKDALIIANKNRESPFKGKDFSHLTQEERNKRFGKHNLGNSYNKGRKHTKEFCERMSLARKGVSNVSLYKKIVRYNKRGELIGIYKSIKDGAYKSGYSEWSIRNICKGLRKTDSNSIFKYAS